MLERFAGGEMSLETPARSQEADGPTLGDSLSDASAPGPDRCVEEAEFSRVLRAKLEAFGATLRGREAQIFRRRLFNDEPVKLTQLAASFGVTRERARQLEGRLKGRIRAYLQAELRDEFEVSAAPDGEFRDASPRTAHSASGVLTMTAEMVEAGWSDAQADCRRVFEENSHPMWVVEALEVVDVNRAALLHYGYSRDEFLAMTVDDLCRRRDAR